MIPDLGKIFYIKSDVYGTYLIDVDENGATTWNHIKARAKLLSAEEAIGIALAVKSRPSPFPDGEEVSIRIVEDLKRIAPLVAVESKS